MGIQRNNNNFVHSCIYNFIIVECEYKEKKMFYMSLETEVTKVGQTTAYSATYLHLIESQLC